MFKNQKVSFYLALAASACALVSLILLAVSNATVGYAIQDSTLAIAATAGAVVLGLLSAAAQGKGMNELLVTALRLLTIFLMTGALLVVLADRASVVGNLFTWNGLDTYAWNAFYTGIACVVFEVLTMLILVVNGFLKQSK